MVSTAIPRIISVDDHVVEPPDLWTARVPTRFGDRVPHVERARAELTWRGHNPVHTRNDESGEWCDWWVYDGLEVPMLNASASIGVDIPDMMPITYDDIPPGSWQQGPRLADLDADHLDASLCFPNVLPRFCGQTFHEADDKELALACVRAYNDWILDDWCAGDGHGHLLPMTIVPLWDIDLAVGEVERCADRGTLAVAFSENPYQLGLPSIHSGEWDPFFAACAAADLTLCMHIGSSSKLPQTSPDAPYIISTCTHFSVTMGSLLDFIFSGTLDRIPGLRLFFAESQAGWLPYVLEQADWFWAKREGSTMGSEVRSPPSSYMDRIFTSIFSDRAALRHRREIGIDQICFETDYPHSVTSFPDTEATVRSIVEETGLSDEEITKLVRGNAIRAFGLGRVGITA